MQPQLGGGGGDRDRFHKAKVSSPRAVHRRVRALGKERRERVSPLREPPLDGVHVHQLSVVVDVDVVREEGEGGMVFAM